MCRLLSEQRQCVGGSELLLEVLVWYLVGSVADVRIRQWDIGRLSDEELEETMHILTKWLTVL